MRIGFNPNKDRPQEDSPYTHQVIIPVYIPHSQDYFKDSLAIFKICLESLLKTIHPATFITIVNNGSSQQVVEYLESQRIAGSIHELIHSPNIGKINAILKGICGHNFELVTISDADVLFLNGWQKASLEIFKAFPKAAAVAPLSFPTFLKYYTAPVWADHWASKRLSFLPVEDPESLKAFAHSIDNPDFYKACHLKKQLVLQQNGHKAAVGSGHFVNTYRGDLFDPPAGKHSNFQLGGDSEPRFVDRPALLAGGYRLSTIKGYVRHMGNSLSPWMQEELAKIQPDQSDSKSVKISLPDLSAGRGRYWWVKLIFKAISQKAIWQPILRSKGLSKEEARNY